MKFMQASEDHMKKHYEDLADKPFYPGLVKYMSSGPLCAMCWGGTQVVKTARNMMGETNPSTPSLAASVVTSALKLAETSSMALTQLNQPIRNLLFGSSLRNSSAGPRATTAGSTSKPRATGEGLETYCF